VRAEPLFRAACTAGAVPETCNIGDRNHTCRHCNAKLWQAEVKRGGSGGALCCSHGRTQELHNIFGRPPPPHLRRLLTADPRHDAEAANFQHNIRLYNTLLCMASTGIKVSNPPTGVSMLAVSGNIHHMLPSLQADPMGGWGLKYAQLYIIDSESAQLAARMNALDLAHRHPPQAAAAADAGGGEAPQQQQAPGQRGAAGAGASVADKLDPHVMLLLQQELNVCNQYVTFYKTAHEFNHNVPIPEYELLIHADGTPDIRRYNAPTTPELAGFVPGARSGRAPGCVALRALAPHMCVHTHTLPLCACAAATHLLSMPAPLLLLLCSVSVPHMCRGWARAHLRPVC
jgi:hypothetical protein